MVNNSPRREPDEKPDTNVLKNLTPQTQYIVNLSNKRLTTAEKEVLNKGLSFLLNQKKTNSREIMPLSLIHI